MEPGPSNVTRVVVVPSYVLVAVFAVVSGDANRIEVSVTVKISVRVNVKGYEVGALSHASSVVAVRMAVRRAAGKPLNGGV